jgi:hypothetical protein
VAILAFEPKDAAATAKALQAGKVNAIIIANENRLRLSVSVFTTHEDIDRVVDVLGGRRPSSAGSRGGYPSARSNATVPASMFGLAVRWARIHDCA